MGQAKREVPLWKQKKAPAGAVSLSRRNQRKYVREVAVQVLADKQRAAAPPRGGALARSGAYRFRYQLVPVAWLAVTFAAGPGLHHYGMTRWGVIGGLAAAALIWLASRHLKGRSRALATALALATAVWVPVLAVTGTGRPWPALAVASWVILQAAWSHHYRWRAQEPQKPRHATDAEIFARLAEKNRWAAHLADCENLPGGGRRWRIVLNGAENHIGDVLAHPRKIAAAYNRAMTEAYVEPSPDGIESTGRLTLLRNGTLDAPVPWDGAGIDLATGLAVLGMFPDRQPVHERWFAPMVGIRHTILSGADGSGKTGALDLGLAISALSGIVAPVILDPQEGQALPSWPGHVPYARGAEECLAFLEGLHDGMLARSRELAGRKWVNDQGRERTGMGFFDAALTGLPIIEVTVDEAPVLLAHPKYGPRAVQLMGGIAKLGRKAGFRLRLAAQVPSLSELGDQALRSMLNGGNVFCFRTGDKVSGGMVGLSADPQALPKYFRDGSLTVGLGYTSGPDNRSGTPMRTLWIRDPAEVAESADIRPLDPLTGGHLERAAGRAATEQQLPLASVPDEEPEQEGRRCADAIEQVLREAGGPVDRADILRSAAKIAEQWGRRRPWGYRAFSDALGMLVTAGKIVKTERGVYALPRASLQLVGKPGSGNEAG